MEDWREGLIAHLEAGGVNALREWQESVKDDDALASSLFRTRLQADMAGQLFIRAVEVPESQPGGSRATSRRVLQDEPDSRPSFMRLTFEEALQSFLDRRLVTQAEYRELLDVARRESFSAVELASESMVLRARDLITRHLAEGGSLGTFIKGMRDGEINLGVEPATPWALETIYRTNVQSAYGAGRLKQLANPVVVAARPFVEYRTVGDSRVRANHDALDGMVLNRATDPGWARWAPPLGYNCFPAGTLVQGSIEAGLRAWYSGELVELRTKGGRVLRVTPNHPLATPSGFVRAGDIREGQDVLGYVGNVDALAPSGVDVEHEPAVIEEVFSALAVGRRRVALRPRAGDLHGDAAFVHGDVDVVGGGGPLGMHRQPQHRQARGDLNLAPSLSGLVQEVSHRGLGLRGVTLRGTPHGGPRAGALPDYRSPVHPSPLEPLRLGPASRHDAALREPAGDDAAADSEFVSQALHGPARFVEPDQVVHVERYAFAGHVYDLQSSGGWIVASGIVTSNCRCSLRSVRTSQVNQSRVTTSNDPPAGGFKDPGFAGAGTIVGPVQTGPGVAI